MQSKVNVLGTTYTIKRKSRRSDSILNDGSDGYCDFSTKEIVVVDNDDFNDFDVKDIEFYVKKTMRHEIMHAFLYESGLHANSDWATNEEIIDWIAIQYPKIQSALEGIDKGIAADRDYDGAFLDD